MSTAVRLERPLLELVSVSCLLSLSTDLGLERLDFSVSSLTVPDLIAVLRDAIEYLQCSSWASIFTCSPRE